MWQSFERVQGAVEGKNVKSGDFLALEGHGPLTISMKALAELELSEIDDPGLATAVFDLQGTMNMVADRRERQLDGARRAPGPIFTDGWLSQVVPTVFNQAAAIERRVAQLMGRTSAL